MKYFKKSAPNVALLLGNGERVKFDRVSENMGVVQVDDRKAMEFTVLASKGIGGITQITQAEFTDLKKNTFGSSWREELGSGLKLERNHQVVALQDPQAVSGVAGAVNAAKAQTVAAPAPTPVLPVGARPTATKRAK